MNHYGNPKWGGGGPYRSYTSFFFFFLLRGLIFAFTASGMHRCIILIVYVSVALHFV